MSSYTCLTCKVNFASNEWQKQHYKSDWHHYNLKRKLVNLAAVPFEVFEKLRIKQQSVEKREGNVTTNYCESCRKLFASSKAFEQHCNSKKHREMKERLGDKTVKQTYKSSSQPLGGKGEVSKLVKDSAKSNETEDDGEALDSDEDDDWESVDEDFEPGQEAIPPKQCFFCSQESESIEDNVTHMSQKHSFFLPDMDYLVDLEALLTYLGEKIGIDHKCLWCSYAGKTFRSIKSTQQHMISKGHTKVKFEQADILMEYADFYDYSKSYPDAGDGVDNDEEVKIDTLNVDDDSWQLVLPSGAVVGHRLLMRYYKQNLRPIVEKTGGTSSNQRILDKVMSNYKALGWTGIKGEAAVLRAKDINYFQKIMAKRNLQLGVKHNKLLQPHFRNQVFF